jgi:hypothetical protein
MRRTIFFYAVMSALAGACSGASSDAGLFGGDDAGLDAAGDSASSSQPGHPNDSDSGPVDATVPAVDARPPHPDASPADAGAADAQPDVDPGIRCFGEPSKYCSLNQICCVTGAETAGICGNKTACTNAGGVAFPCADTRNCLGVAAGDVCCAAWDDVGARYTSVACQTSCANDGTEHQLCDPSAKPDECLAVGLACKKPPAGTGYAYCQ